MVQLQRMARRAATKDVHVWGGEMVEEVLTLRLANRRRSGSAIDALVCKRRNQVLFKIQIFLEG